MQKARETFMRPQKLSLLFMKRVGRSVAILAQLDVFDEFVFVVKQGS